MRPLTTVWDVGADDETGAAQQELAPARLRRRMPLRSALGRRALAMRILALVVMVAMAGTGYLAIVSGGKGNQAVLLSVSDRLDRLAIAAGFGVDQISITGRRFASDNRIFDALGVSPAISLLRFDARAARARIEALPWIKSARLMRVFPDRLSVEVRERVPFAIWQNNDTRKLIDAEGHVLGQIAVGYDIGLPIVVGKGAPGAAQRLVSALKRHPDLLARTKNAERIGQRRWTLRLHNGMAIRLPAEGAAEALDQLQKLHARMQILDRDILSVDLRMSSRVTVRRARGVAAVPVGVPGRAPTSFGHRT